MNARSPLTVVWRLASSTARCQNTSSAQASLRSTNHHTRLLSTSIARRAPGSNAPKQERRDVAASNPDPTSLHERFENEQERQQTASPTTSNIPGNTETTPSAAPGTPEQPRGPIRTALSNRPRPASTTRSNLLSRFDNDSSLDFLTQPAKPNTPTSQQARPTPAKPTGSLAEDLQKMIQQMRHSKNDIRSNDGRVDSASMLSPQRPEGYDPLEAMRGFSLRPQAAPVDISPAPFRIGPSLGRTVMVKPEANMDLARAFRTLEVACNNNSVKRDFNKQRFHERGGTRRKRLASERWRRRFKEAFKATVRRVDDMRRKGW